MSVPILKHQNILVASIQVDLSDQEALDFQSDLLHMVTETEAQGVVVDITALNVVDSYMARVISDTATMVQLLGAAFVLCGMQPAVALTLIEMGRGLLGVQTALNLDQGMAKLQRQLKK